MNVPKATRTLLVVHSAGQYRKVVTSDAQSACLQRLLALGTFRGINDRAAFFNNRTGVFSRAECQRLNLWMNHAIDYFETAAHTQSLARYLVAYYGVLNLARFVIAVKTGNPVADEHHGLSRKGVSVRRQQNNLKRYSCFVKLGGAFPSFAKCIFDGELSGQKELTLVDLLLTDPQSSEVTSAATQRHARCVPGLLHVDGYFKEKRLVENEKSIPRGRRPARTYDFTLYPKTASEVALLETKWREYVWPDDPRNTSLRVPAEKSESIDLGYEEDGTNDPSCSLRLPCQRCWWPSAMRQFAGSWMLADLVRYLPELLAPGRMGVDAEIQAACAMFSNGVMRGFPLRCLHYISAEEIRFSPSLFID